MGIVGVNLDRISLNSQKFPSRISNDHFKKILSQVETKIRGRQNFENSKNNDKQAKDEENNIIYQDSNDEDDLLNLLPSGSTNGILQLLQTILGEENQNLPESQGLTGQNTNQTVIRDNLTDAIDALSANVSSFQPGIQKTNTQQLNDFSANHNHAGQAWRVFAESVINKLKDKEQNDNSNSMLSEFEDSYLQLVQQGISNTNINLNSVKSKSSLTEDNLLHEKKSLTQRERNQHSINGTDLNTKLAQQVGNEAQPSKTSSLNTELLEVLQNVLTVSTGQHSSVSAVEAGGTAERGSQRAGSLLTRMTNQSISQLSEGTHDPINEKNVNTMISQQHAGNEVQPSEKSNLNAQILEVLQNVLGVSIGQQSSVSAVEAGGTAERSSPIRGTPLIRMTNQPTSRPFSHLEGRQASTNGTDVNTMLAQQQTGNETQPSKTSSLNTELLEVLQNVLGDSSEQQSSVSAVEAGGTAVKDSQGVGSLLNGMTNQPISQLSEESQSQNLVNGSRVNELLFKNSTIREILQNKIQLSNSDITLKQNYLINRSFQKENTNDRNTGENVNNSNFITLASEVNDNSSIFLPQMSRLEQFVLMTQGANKVSSNTENLIQQFESILGRSQFSKTGTTQKLSISLKPENLGSLRIELIQKDRTTVARIITTTDAAKEVLESHLHSLKNAFAAQNISISKVEIETQLLQSQQERFSNSEQQHQKNRQNSHQKQQENNKEDESESTFILSLDDALLNKKV